MWTLRAGSQLPRFLLFSIFNGKVDATRVTNCRSRRSSWMLLCSKKSFRRQAWVNKPAHGDLITKLVVDEMECCSACWKNICLDRLMTFWPTTCMCSLFLSRAHPDHYPCIVVKFILSVSVSQSLSVCLSLSLWNKAFLSLSEPNRLRKIKLTMIYNSFFPSLIHSSRLSGDAKNKTKNPPVINMVIVWPQPQAVILVLVVLQHF